MSSIDGKDGYILCILLSPIMAIFGLWLYAMSYGYPCDTDNAFHTRYRNDSNDVSGDKP
jgi:hypothetical protein